MASLIFDLMLELLFAPLVLAPGHFVLRLFGVKPLKSEWLDGVLVATVGICLWMLAVGAIVLLLLLVLAK